MGRHIFRSSLLFLVLAIAALALGQSFTSDGSGTLTIAGRRNQIARVRTEPSGNRVRIIMWTTTDKRFDLVGDNAKQGDSYRVRIDDGLGERSLTGFANIYTSDWTTLKSITASGRFSGGTFDLSFQANRGGGGGWNPGPGNGGGRMGDLNIAGVRYRVDKADYRINGNSVRLVLTTDNGKEYHLVGSRDRRGNVDNLDFDDGLGEERLNGTGRVNYSNGEVTNASGRGNFRGGSFSFDVRWNGNGGGSGGGNGGGRPGPDGLSGKLRFDNNSRSVTRVEYNQEGGNRFRLILWTTEGKRYDVLGTRRENGNRDRLTIDDGLGKERMSGSGTVQFNNNSSRGRVTSVSISGTYRGGSFTVNLDSR